MEETLKHIKAFNLYYVMGEDRSLKKLLKKLDHNHTTAIPSLGALKSWSRSFHWQERIKQTDAEVSKILKEKLKETAAYSKEGYRKLVKEVVDQFKEKLKDKKIKLSKPQDIIEMIKLDLVMMGESTDRQVVLHTLVDVDIGKYPKQKEG